MIFYNTKAQNTAVGVFVLLAVVLFGFFILRHVVNVPYMDDLELIGNVNDIQNTPSKLFSILTKQLNDHRLVFSRIGILLAYLLTGTIDFKASAILGFFNLILLGFSFFLVYRSRNRGNLAFVPIVFLLFTANIFLAHLWGLLAFENTLAVAFSILCLYFLQSEKEKYWAYAIPLAVFSTLTNLEAVTVIPVGFCWLLFQRRGKHSLYFFVFCVVYLTIYFTDFKISAASKFAFTAESIPIIIKSLLVAVGAQAKTISDTHGILLSMIFGGFILAFVFGTKLASVFQNVRKTPDSPRLEIDLTDVCFLKILAALVMIAVGRYADGIDNMVALRFQIYSVSMTIIFYLFLLKTFKHKSLYFIKIGTLSVAILLWGMGYKKYAADINYTQAGLRADSYNYPHYRLYLHQYFNLLEPAPEFYKNYLFPDIFNQSTIDTWKDQSESSTESVSSMFLRKVTKGERNRDEMYEFLKLEVSTAHQLRLPADVYLGLSLEKSPDLFYLLAFKKGNTNLSDAITGRITGNKLLCDLPKKVPAGSYTAKMCWIEDGRAKSILLPEKISL